MPAYTEQEARKAVECVLCRRSFVPRYDAQRYCSSDCGRRHDRRRRGAQPSRRKVPRPPYQQLLEELEGSSYLAVSRKYGVSDNAIRKWVRSYEQHSGGSPPRRTRQAL